LSFCPAAKSEFVSPSKVCSWFSLLFNCFTAGEFSVVPLLFCVVVVDGAEPVVEVLVVVLVVVVVGFLTGTDPTTDTCAAGGLAFGSVALPQAPKTSAMAEITSGLETLEHLTSPP
jgi:hypothetical protein